MIVITGAAGFIGSNLIQRLNQDNFNTIIAVDKFDYEVKNKNLIGLKIRERVDWDVFLNWLDKNYETVELIFHMGATTNMADPDLQLLYSLNTDFTKEVWKRCCDYQIPLVYVSPAVIYRSGEFGNKDDESKNLELKPVNQHELSKQEFDVWALQQSDKPFFWAGLTLFDIGRGQKQDFRYIKKVTDVCVLFMHQRKDSGIYVLGPGQA